jgi:hypothetical protein
MEAAFIVPDFAVLATKLLERARTRGLARIVTLRRLDTTPPEPAMPWRGPVEPRATPAATLSVTACFVDPSSARDLELSAELVDWLKRAQQVAIMASASDLGDFSEVVDTDASVWRIEGVSTLKPGPMRLVHFVGVPGEASARNSAALALG